MHPHLHSLSSDYTAPFTLGWDIGGAHLKVAVIDQTGTLIAVEQYPCALWRGLDQLTPLLQKVMSHWAPIARHAVTMSGEMVDLFSDRRSGVRALIHTFSGLAGRVPVSVYCADNTFLSLAEVEGRESEIASANWLASAAWAARHFERGIFLDIGSTTTDVVCFEQGKPKPIGIGDADRLISEELLYTGVIRTPLMALAQRIEWRQGSRGVMAELFATTADVYRVLGLLPDDADQHDTADGGPKTRSASITRIARMIGLDGHEFDEAAWSELAQVWQGLQLKQIDHAIAHVSQGWSSASQATHPIPLVVAGVGRFLANNLPEAQQDPTLFSRIDFGTLGKLIQANRENRLIQDYASRCAPAVAVAALTLEER